MKKSFLTIAAVSAIALTSGYALAYGGGDKSEKTKMEKAEKKAMKKNIVETAVSNENFSTLVTAVKQAELVEALSNPEAKFTVFAPTNDAFAQVPEESLAALLKDENKEQLQSVLKYHVIGKKIKAADIPEGRSKIETLQGQEITIFKDESGVTVDGQKVVIADVKTSNGVIHAIEGVVMPQ
ncbi:MAG: fasciclin domain-containing protein [Pseudomonadota bacterium]